LHPDIACLFSEQARPWLPEQHARQVDQGHGRLTIRSLRTSGRPSGCYFNPCDF
jgi:hypothetical protein